MPTSVDGNKPASAMKAAFDAAVPWYSAMGGVAFANLKRTGSSQNASTLCFATWFPNMDGAPTCACPHNSEDVTQNSGGGEDSVRSDRGRCVSSRCRKYTRNDVVEETRTMCWRHASKSELRDGGVSKPRRETRDAIVMDASSSLPYLRIFGKAYVSSALLHSTKYSYHVSDLWVRNRMKMTPTHPLLEQSRAV